MADKITVGNVEITAVLDMIPPPREATAMFPETTAADWAAHEDALENGQLQLYYGCFVIRSQGQVILVDTGLGPGPHPDRGNVTGNLYEELRPILIPADRLNNTNVSPSDEINTVVHTHLHGDHIGWNVRYQGGMPAPTFRKARYLVPKADWDYFTAPENADANPMVQRYVAPSAGCGRWTWSRVSTTSPTRCPRCPLPATPRATKRYWFLPKGRKPSW